MPFSLSLPLGGLIRFYGLDLSRFDAAHLTAFIAAKEPKYGSETDGLNPR